MFSICIRLLVYYYCAIKIYVGINATAQEVFSICIQLLGVLFGFVRTSVGIKSCY